MANSLKELKYEVENLQGCTLKKTATNLVFSDGNSNAKVMLIGEAPGEEEDKTGKPFQGKAGVLMTVAQADGATITKTDNGTYFIKDEYATIAAAAAQSGGTATNAAKFKAIFRANEVQVTNYAKTQDFAAIVPVAADGISNTEIATAYNKVDTGVTASLGSVKVTLSDNTTYNDTEAALASNISKIDIASGKTLTIESDAFDNSSNELLNGKNLFLFESNISYSFHNLHYHL